MDTKDERAKRLAAELRANLHRRKAQARGVVEEQPDKDRLRKPKAP